MRCLSWAPKLMSFFLTTAGWLPDPARSGLLPSELTSRATYFLFLESKYNYFSWLLRPLHCRIVRAGSDFFPSATITVNTHNTQYRPLSRDRLLHDDPFNDKIQVCRFKQCTAFQIIDGAQVILKSQNEATAHDQRWATWFRTAKVFDKLKFVLFRCISCKGK